MMQTIPLFTKDRTLHNFLRDVNPAFSDAQLSNAARICQGLVSGLVHKSIYSIAESLLESRDQSSLNRFLTKSDWGCEVEQMDVNRALLMQSYRQTAMTSKGVICIDDTLLEKSGKKMDLVGEHFDHCTFRMKQGLSLVSMNYCDNGKNYNFFKKIYVRKKYLLERNEIDQFKTKIELACQMITNLIDTVPSLSEIQPYFTFDSWFLAKDVTALLENHGFKYVSRAKSNRVVKGLDMSLKEYAASVLRPSDFVCRIFENGEKNDTAYFYSAILPISNMGDVKVVFIKPEKKGEVSCFLVSNDVRLSSEEIAEKYSLRWGIETDYKFSKQELGLSDFHLRKKRGILRYLTLCLLSSTFLEYYRLMGAFGRCFGRDADLSTKGREARAYRHLEFERFLLWLDEQFSSGKSVADLLYYFREDSLRTVRGIRFVCQSTRLSLKCGAC
ncbi:MAG: transposase [Candidatus Lokiarchaeota archaeon]|nr:transposase [Candidatus Lokiarchaeota archaeon]